MINLSISKYYKAWNNVTEQNTAIRIRMIFWKNMALNWFWVIVVFLKVFSEDIVKGETFMVVYDSQYSSQFSNNSDVLTKNKKWNLLKVKSFKSLTKIMSNHTLFSFTSSFEYLEHAFPKHFGFGASLKQMVRWNLLLKFSFSICLFGFTVTILLVRNCF